ncbi:cytochrome P450 [Saccharopolyspora karakumensis]|uniref:Cytochrome P450 n=1 Tax=Saccharopolyspora karakumensis TaxID=2530386 RepID=A0A4R5BLK6_9PSEU|nr:cytochrome P450 [Saccharopolyspora karakumensis]TDD85960.1 cytochrome P450 [Saccharopolyspora karakumensis]
MSSGVVFSPYDYAVHADPYPTYARLRDEAPVYHNAELDFWALSRYSDVAALFRDNTRLSNANGVTLDPAAWGPYAHKTMSFLALDDPRHNRLRSLVSRGFTPRRVRDLQPRILELARRHLHPALESGEFDFVADFAGKFPMDVISELIGVPEADRDRLRELADTLVHREEGVFDVPQTAMEAALHLVAYYSDLLAERRRKRADDLTSALLDAEIDGDRLSDEEIIAFLVLMVVAGNETTTKLLANAAYWAHRNPEEQAKPLIDPGRVTDWIEETLRYDTSTQVIARTATEEIRLHETTIPTGARVLLMPGSANRDPRAFDDADRYDLDRSADTKIVSFGGGTHFCLGAHLARLEARIALTEFVELVKSYDVDTDRAQRVHSSNVRGFATLPVRVESR